MSSWVSHGWMMYFYCAFGALILWSKLTYEHKKLQSYGDVIENVFTSPRTIYLVQFAVFVLLGGLIAKAIVAPASEGQALAAGMAWSRLTARE